MKTMTNKDRFVVIHPLDDRPEQKVDIEALGPMRLTRSVRWSLLSLRGYLILMLALVLYRVATLAGVVGRHLH
jgi:hypothetical protein